MLSLNKVKNAINSGLFVLFLSFIFPTDSQAQDTLKSENNFNIRGQLRTRFELRDGAFRPLTKKEQPATLVSERIRLTFDYAYKDLFTIKISPQTVGVWGQANMVQGAEYSGNQFALFEAWSKINLSPSVNIKIGRQVITLDDERFFGELDWAQGGRAHDALAINIHKKSFELRGYASFNQNYKVMYANNLNNPSGNLYSTTDGFPYKWMQTIWANIPAGKYFRFTVLANNLGFQQATYSTTDTNTIFTQTFGLNNYFKKNKTDIHIAAYYQYCDNSQTINTNAFLITANAAFQINNKFNLGLGSDYVSGNDVGQTNKINHAFNPYFHTGHKFYGNMDYYYAGNPHKNTGISDSYLKVNYKTTGKLVLNAALHQFISPNKISDSYNKKYNSNLGQELDLSFSFKTNTFVTFTGGYSFYLATTTLKYLKNTPGANDYQQWFWLSLNVTPHFLKTNF
ncbi:MAG: alginate export family protein [Bacteroidia bacterium]|nr:alginate export family protein [Bacteroidia bacterium]